MTEAELMKTFWQLYLEGDAFCTLTAVIHILTAANVTIKRKYLNLTIAAVKIHVNPVYNWKSIIFDNINQHYSQKLPDYYETWECIYNFHSICLETVKFAACQFATVIFLTAATLSIYHWIIRFDYYNIILLLYYYNIAIYLSSHPNILIW